MGYFDGFDVFLDEFCSCLHKFHILFSGVFFLLLLLLVVFIKHCCGCCPKGNHIWIAIDLCQDYSLTKCSCSLFFVWV